MSPLLDSNQCSWCCRSIPKSLGQRGIFVGRTRIELVTHTASTCCSTQTELPSHIYFWRKMGDSNPHIAFTMNGLANRRSTIMTLIFHFYYNLLDNRELNPSLWFFRPLYNNHLYDYPILNFVVTVGIEPTLFIRTQNISLMTKPLIHVTIYHYILESISSITEKGDPPISV